MERRENLICSEVSLWIRSRSSSREKNLIEVSSAVTRRKEFCWKSSNKFVRFPFSTFRMAIKRKTTGFCSSWKNWWSFSSSARWIKFSIFERKGFFDAEVFCPARCVDFSKIDLKKTRKSPFETNCFLLTETFSSHRSQFDENSGFERFSSTSFVKFSKSENRKFEQIFFKTSRIFSFSEFSFKISCSKFPSNFKWRSTSSKPPTSNRHELSIRRFSFWSIEFSHFSPFSFSEIFYSEKQNE